MQHNRDLKVINIFGGPCSGKSTNAAGLFHLMKKDYCNVELVTEYAKDLTWQERYNMLTEQDYLFAKQNHSLRRLVNKVDYAITDSPLLLCLIYMPDNYPKTFIPFCKEVFNSYTNINIFLNRTHKYFAVGRNQSEEQADFISNRIKNLLDNEKIMYYNLDTDECTAEIIYDIVRCIKQI